MLQVWEYESGARLKAAKRLGAVKPGEAYNG